jgi:hypothetical protein
MYVCMYTAAHVYDEILQMVDLCDNSGMRYLLTRLKEIVANLTCYGLVDQGLDLCLQRSERLWDRRSFLPIP